MPLRGLVLDVSGTLLTASGPIPGIDTVWALCRRHRIRLILASNQPAQVARLRAYGYVADYEAMQGKPGIMKRKPSPAYITVPAAHFGLNLNEVVYVGDDDATDAVTASNARVLYLRADWANPHGRYGIGLPRLASVARYVEIFLLKSHPWYWSATNYDSRGRPFGYRALVDCRTTVEAQRQVKTIAVEVLKEKRDKAHEPFFLNHLLTSLYLSGLIEDVDFWTTYPSHDKGSVAHPVLAPYLARVSIQFHDKYRALLMRHAEAPSSRRTRWGDRIPTFQTQMDTVTLDANYRREITGRHILIVDDFTTATYSFEWARNLLYGAGATAVTCVAVGKFGRVLNIVVPRDGTEFDPFVPAARSSADFERNDYGTDPGTIKWDEETNRELQDSLSLFDHSSPW